MNSSSSHQKISPESLLTALNAAERPLILDVRTAGDYEMSRIPGSVNNCVYEIQFLERMKSIAPPAEKQSICVYGYAPGTQDARMAAEKLTRAGYREVLELQGGLEAWEKTGGALEQYSCDDTVPSSISDGRHEIDRTESKVEWIGRNLLNRHHGILGILNGHLDFQAGLPAGGEFVFNMNDIVCTNLAGDPLHDVLVDHLRSHDFFDTQHYPEARYRILSSSRINGGTSGSPNLHIRGELSLKGRELPLDFDAVAGFTPEGHAAAQAVLAFDRTAWDVIYGSARFFRNLGMHLVNDLIEIHLRIIAK